jgi:hypothetical protein
LGNEFRRFPGIRYGHNRHVFRYGRRQETSLMLYGTLSRLTDQIDPRADVAGLHDPRRRKLRSLVNIWHAVSDWLKALREPSKP